MAEDYGKNEITVEPNAYIKSTIQFSIKYNKLEFKIEQSILDYEKFCTFVFSVEKSQEYT